MAGTKKTQKKKAAARKPRLDMDALLTKIVSLLVRHNPQDLTFSKVSRLSKVPRSTLYYYFGSSKESMLEEAMKFGFQAFVRLYRIDEEQAFSSWKEFQEHRLRRVIQNIQNYPFAPAIYFRYRNQVGPIGSSIKRAENQYLEKIAKAWERYHGSKPDDRAVRLSAYLKVGLLYGFSQELDLWKDEKSVDRAVQDLTRVITEVMEGNYTA